MISINDSRMGIANKRGGKFYKSFFRIFSGDRNGLFLENFVIAIRGKKYIKITRILGLLFQCLPAS